MRALKRTAQANAAKQRNLHTGKLDEARERLNVAEDAVHDDDAIAVDLPETAVPSGRTVLRVEGAELRSGATVDLELRGPERVALLGANGSGKTTLLETITGRLDPNAGVVRAAVPMRYLPQRLTVLDDAETVIANVARLAPAATVQAIRSRLARFHFRGVRADQIVGRLSGGERFRATLAALMLAEPAPQLMLLDEPTNNLDIASAEQLSQALAAYEGALIVASHDVGFLRTLGITRWLQLDGTLAQMRANPKDAMQYLGAVNQLRGELEEAKKMADAADTAPEFMPGVWLRLGRAYYEAALFWESIVAYEEILARFPNSKERETALYAAMVSYAEANRPQAARKLG